MIDDMLMNLHAWAIRYTPLVIDLLHPLCPNPPSQTPLQQLLQILPPPHLFHQIPKVPIPSLRPLLKLPHILLQPLPILARLHQTHISQSASLLRQQTYLT